MNLAKAERFTDVARAASLDIARRNRHVSLIFNGNQLVSIGRNQGGRTHPLAYHYGYPFGTVHSELDGYSKLRHSGFHKLTLINYHFNKRGEVKLAKPCRFCIPWVSQIFKEVIYSTPEGFQRL